MNKFDLVCWIASLILFLALIGLMIISLIPKVSALENTELLYCADNSLNLTDCLSFWIEIYYQGRLISV